MATRPSPRAAAGRARAGRPASPIALALQEADERLGERVGLLDLEALAKSTDLVPLHMPKGSRSHGWHGNLLLARAGVRLPLVALHGYSVTAPLRPCAKAQAGVPA